jgi:hypothetical protein
LATNSLQLWIYVIGYHHGMHRRFRYRRRIRNAPVSEPRSVTQKREYPVSNNAQLSLALAKPCSINTSAATMP